MAGKSSKSKSKQRRQRKKKSKQRIPQKAWNFVDDAGPGCHIARSDLGDDSSFVLEWEDISREDFQGEEIPDIAIDPDAGVLSLCNAEEYYVVAYISVFDNTLKGKDGMILQSGITVSNDNAKSEKCTTLIALCPPETFAHLCYIDLKGAGKDLENLRIESDVQEWSRHPNPEDTHPTTVAFPFEASDQSFLCTQAEGGQLTHFFSGNLHAIDFRCPIGTPLVAVRNARVVEVHTENTTLTGVAVGNLFKWNSIMLQIEDAPSDDPLYVEYVHIESACVNVGDRVVAGQTIAMSGSVGFSPEPHLHFCAYRTSDVSAPTVRVRFHSAVGDGENSTFLPKAGQYYNAQGVVVIQKAGG